MQSTAIRLKTSILDKPIPKIKNDVILLISITKRKVI